MTLSPLTARHALVHLPAGVRHCPGDAQVLVCLGAGHRARVHAQRHVAREEARQVLLQRRNSVTLLSFQSWGTETAEAAARQVARQQKQCLLQMSSCLCVRSTLQCRRLSAGVALVAASKPSQGHTAAHLQCHSSVIAERQVLQSCTEVLPAGCPGGRSCWRQRMSGCWPWCGPSAGTGSHPPPSPTTSATSPPVRPHIAGVAGVKGFV